MGHKAAGARKGPRLRTAAAAAGAGTTTGVDPAAQLATMDMVPRRRRQSLPAVGGRARGVARGLDSARRGGQAAAGATTGARDAVWLLMMLGGVMVRVMVANAPTPAAAAAAAADTVAATTVHRTRVRGVLSVPGVRARG